MNDTNNSVIDNHGRYILTYMYENQMWDQVPGRSQRLMLGKSHPF